MKFSSAVGRWKLENITTTDEPSQESTKFWAENKILFVRVWIVSCCWQQPPWHDTSWGLSTSDSYGGAKDRTKLSSLFKADTGKQKKKLWKSVWHALWNDVHTWLGIIFFRENWIRRSVANLRCWTEWLQRSTLNALFVKGLDSSDENIFSTKIIVRIKTKNTITFKKSQNKPNKLKKVYFKKAIQLS